MYTSFEIQNFRGFKDFKLEKLARINLIAGQNNVGKTALLEALWIHSTGYNPEIVIRANLNRGIRQFNIADMGKLVSDIWKPAFRDFDFNNVIKLTAHLEPKMERIVNLQVILQQTPEVPKTIISGNDGLIGSSSSYPATVLRMTYRNEQGKELTGQSTIDQNGLTSTPVTITPIIGFFISNRTFNSSEVKRQFSKLVLDGKKHIIMDSIRLIEPLIKNIEVLEFVGEDLLWAEIEGKKPIPIVYSGDGMNAILRAICALGYAQNGILLIDEIENGLHYSVQKDVWKVIQKAAIDFNVQVFATTHSRECILAAHEAFTELGAYDDFQYIRLEKRKDNRILAIPFSQGSTEAAFEKHLEIR